MNMVLVRTGIPDTIHSRKHDSATESSILSHCRYPGQHQMTPSYAIWILSTSAMVHQSAAISTHVNLKLRAWWCGRYLLVVGARSAPVPSFTEVPAWKIVGEGDRWQGGTSSFPTRVSVLRELSVNLFRTLCTKITLKDYLSYIWVRVVVCGLHPICRICASS